MNANVCLLTSSQAKHILVTSASDFLTLEFLGAKTAPTIAFREEIQLLMKEAPNWSQCPHLYQAVRANTPFINAGITNLFLNNIWPNTSFASSQHDLEKATRLFLWCPADRRSPAFQAQEEAVLKTDQAERMCTNKDKAAESIPLLASCTCLLDVVSALLFMSAAARICCDEVEDSAPALPWLLDFAASTICTPVIEDMFTNQGPKEELLSHYLLHVLQEIFRNYIIGVTNYKQKQRVTQNGCVFSTNWDMAARAIMLLPDKIEMLVTADLSPTGLATLQHEKPRATVTQVNKVSYTSYPA